MAERTEALADSIAIMARLRGPDGCPWDRAQTFETIKRHTLEETYEVFDAIERKDWLGLKDELGDLLLQVLFHAQMAEDQGLFAIEDVAANLNAKLLRRHPHVFAGATAATPEEVALTWEAVKKKEREGAEGAKKGLLDEVPRHMPALLEAAKLGKRAASVGFDWPDTQGILAKVREETEELAAEVMRSPKHYEALEMELGDLLFTAVNLARHLQVEPEFALRSANAKFRKRFKGLETHVGGAGRMQAMTPEELDSAWSAVKRNTDG